MRLQFRHMGKLGILASRMVGGMALSLLLLASLVEPLQARQATTIAGGASHCLGVRSDGVTVAWGFNNKGQCNVPPSSAKVVAVAAGWAHSLALKSDGTLVIWGNNWFGQCDMPGSSLKG